MLTMISIVFNLQNCSGGVDQDCIAAYEPTNETWKCFMAQVYNNYHNMTDIFLCSF